VAYVFICHADTKLVLYKVLFRKRGLSAVCGVTRGLSQEGKRSWNVSISHYRGVTSQHSETIKKWWWIRFGWLYVL